MEVEGEKKPRRRRWLRRLGVVVLVLVVLLAGIKVTDMAMTAYERASHPAPGQLVDVEGHTMHVHTVGGVIRVLFCFRVLVSRLRIWILSPW